MLCDSCQKKTVCKYKEQCNILENTIQDSCIEEIICLKVSCKQYMGQLATSTAICSISTNSDGQVTIV